MSLIVRLPEELTRRVEAAATRRGVSPEQVAVEAIDAQLPDAGGGDAGDALEAFIGCGASGRSEPFDIRRARADLAARKLAEGA